MKRTGQLEKAADQSLIGSLLHGNDAFQFYLFQQKWKAIAGDVLAEESRIGRKEGTTLYIHVTNSVWMQELIMRKKELLQRIQEDPYGRQFQDLRFMIAAPQEKETGLSAVDLLRQRMAEENGMKPLPLTEGETAWIAQWTASHVRAEKIRPAIREMMERALSLRKAQLAAGYHPCRRCGELIRKEETLCLRCRIEEERAILHRITLLLTTYPSLLYEEARRYIPCRYSQFAAARDGLIHKYKENYANGWGTEEEKRKLLSLLTHKPYEKITKEEADRALSALPKRKKFRN